MYFQLKHNTIMRHIQLDFQFQFPNSIYAKLIKDKLTERAGREQK